MHRIRLTIYRHFKRKLYDYVALFVETLLLIHNFVLP